METPKKTILKLARACLCLDKTLKTHDAENKEKKEFKILLKLLEAIRLLV